MSAIILKEKDSNQLSMLGFVDSPDLTTGKDRKPRSQSLKRLMEKAHIIVRGSSSSSKSTKCKSMDTAFTPKEKRLINILLTNGHLTLIKNKNVQTLPEPQCMEEDIFSTVLKQMEEWMTAMMKSMFKPLHTSINSLMKSQNEWQNHEEEVKSSRIHNNISLINFRKLNLKTKKSVKRVKRLEDKLMEGNMILHIIKELAWELDSIRRGLVVQAIADTVNVQDSNKILGSSMQNPH